MTDGQKLLTHAWHLTPCPRCRDAMIYEYCASCRGRGHASLAQFSKHALGRNPRVVARYIAGKLPLPPLVAARCQSILDQIQHAMTKAAATSPQPAPTRTDPETTIVTPVR